jgi:hypothetical protein
MQAPATPDPDHCPLCGQTNLCAMQAQRLTGVKQGPCWCTQVDFERSVLDALPAAARGKACICQACATRKLAGQPGTAPSGEA